MAAAVAGTFALAGCDDFLDAENKSAGGTTADDFFAGNPASMLTSAYGSLKNFNNQVDMNDQGSDLYINTRGKTAGDFNQFSFDAENNTIKSYYSNCYSTINYANGYLHYSGETGTAAAQEARFIRAYAYYCLTQHFGGVPYVTNYVNTSERNYPRTPLAELYGNLTADLEDIYNNCQLAAEDHASGRPSKQAVAALLAKIYLAWGWDIDRTVADAAAGTYTGRENAHFNASADWATKAINGKGLTQPFARKWAPDNEGNDEFVWVINYDAGVIEGAPEDNDNGQSGNYGGYYGTNQKGVGSENQQSEKSMYLFEEGDERYEGTFMTTFYQGDTPDDAYYAYYTCTPEQLATHAINLKFFPYWVTVREAETWFDEHKDQLKKGSPNVVKAAILALPNVTTYTFKDDGSVNKKETKTLEVFNAETENGVCVRKFDDPVNKANCFRDIVLIDLSEIYLVRAEANWLAGNTTGFWSDINAVRTRAQAPAITAIGQYKYKYSLGNNPSFGNITELDLLLDERARECYAQKMRYLDLHRTKQLVRYNIEFNGSISSAANMTGLDGNIKWLRPIPSAELNNNTGMTSADQNPGYVVAAE